MILALFGSFAKPVMSSTSVEFLRRYLKAQKIPVIKVINLILLCSQIDILS